MICNLNAETLVTATLQNPCSAVVVPKKEGRSRQARRAWFKDGKDVNELLFPIPSTLNPAPSPSGQLIAESSGTGFLIRDRK
jgi:hypothetical protein